MVRVQTACEPAWNKLEPDADSVNQHPALNFFNFRMMLSKKSATFWHHALEPNADSVNQHSALNSFNFRMMLSKKPATFWHHALKFSKADPEDEG
jgi:hypothetical protein